MSSHANFPRIMLTSAVVLAALCVGCSQGVGGRAEAASGAAPSTPRLADGHPDLNGVWDNGSGIDFIRPQKSADGSVCLLGCAPAPRPVAAADRGAPPPPPPANFPRYRPQFLAKVKQLNEQQLQADPVLHCRSPGLPRIGPPDKIVQTPGQMVFLYDDVSGAFWRIVPTDGRAHRTDVEDSSLGDSVGHWEGDTLVVEATKFSDDTWLTDNGAFHTSDMRVTERMRRNGDTLEWQATVDDPQVLEQSWKTQVRMAKLTKQELVEPTPCVDQDIAHVVDKTHHDNPR
ncbi:MAG TPA: hypothetical protein VMG11_06295 [Steroidobacteraceae bacterium]|nr:hypothetical protein [Steroidobacteraceae bacterium]